MSKDRLFIWCCLHLQRISCCICRDVYKFVS